MGELDHSDCCIATFVLTYDQLSFLKLFSVIYDCLCNNCSILSCGSDEVMGISEYKKNKKQTGCSIEI